jgi:hypothetical protein
MDFNNIKKLKSQQSNYGSVTLLIYFRQLGCLDELITEKNSMTKKRQKSSFLWKKKHK